MSYILDALRKSERERQHAEPLVLHPIGSEAIGLPRPRVGLTVAIAVLVLAAIGLAAYWTLVSDRVGVAPTSNASVVPLAELPKAGSVPETAHADKARPLTPEIRPAPKLKPNPFVAARSRSTVRDLATEARVELPQPSPPTVAPSTPATSVTAATPTVVERDAIKFLRAMPAEFQRELPDLRVTIHIYAPQQSDRILYVNDRQYRAGEQVRDGVAVEEIVPDGVVLTFRGQRFKLPRPT